MTVPTLAQTPLTGKSLFSLHYLETRPPGQPEWAEDPQAAFDAVRLLWQKARRYGGAWNEAQTKDEFVKPVLAVLGWSYIPQVKNSRSGRINRPDYALFADEATKNAAYPHQGDDDPFYSRSLAIAEAKYWGRPSAGRTPTAAIPGRPTTTPAIRWSATWWARAVRGASSPMAARGASTAARLAAPPVSSTRLTWMPFSRKTRHRT